MSKTQKTVDFLELLTLVFIVAKLWGKINCSWFAVFAPLWLPALFAVVYAILAGIFAIFCSWQQVRELKAWRLRQEAEDKERARVRFDRENEVIVKQGLRAYSRVHTEKAIKDGEFK